MNCQLVLQWSASSLEDHNAVVKIQDDLTDALSEIGDVDGYDFGSGEMNIFIYVNDPRTAFNQTKATLEAHGRLVNVRAAYRDVDGEDFTVLWPEGLSTFEVS
jgi:hypothetical protein